MGFRLSDQTSLCCNSVLVPACLPSCAFPVRALPGPPSEAPVVWRAKKRRKTTPRKDTPTPGVPPKRRPSPPGPRHASRSWFCPPAQSSRTARPKPTKPTAQSRGGTAPRTGDGDPMRVEPGGGGDGRGTFAFTLRNNQKKFVKRSAAIRLCDFPYPTIKDKHHGKRRPETGPSHPVDRQYKSNVLAIARYTLFFSFFAETRVSRKKRKCLGLSGTKNEMQFPLSPLSPPGSSPSRLSLAAGALRVVPGCAVRPAASPGWASPGRGGAGAASVALTPNSRHSVGERPKLWKRNRSRNTH